MPLPAVQRVIAFAALQNIVSLATRKLVAAAHTRERVIAVTANDSVVAFAGNQVFDADEPICRQRPDLLCAKAGYLFGVLLNNAPIAPDGLQHCIQRMGGALVGHGVYTAATGQDIATTAAIEDVIACACI